MRVALCLGGGEVGVVRSFLGVRSEFFVGQWEKQMVEWMVGQVGLLMIVPPPHYSQTE